ncbi:FAD-dependent oxidoreductase [Aerococcus urinae]
MSNKFKAVVEGFHGPIQVEVGIDPKLGKIDSLDVDYSDQALVGGLGIEQMKKNILAKGSSSVDAITGASFSTRALRSAVEKAVALAQGKISTADALDPSVFAKVEDGIDATSSASQKSKSGPKNTSPVEPAIPYRDDLDPAETYDVIVVGAGGAGLAAACEASQAGLKVLICEKAGIAGGTTNYSGGVIQAAGTDQQKEFTEFTDDSPAKHYQLWLKAGEESLDPELVKDLAQGAPDNIKWLERLGIHWTSVYGHSHIPYIEEDLHADRIHVYEGGGAGGQGVVLTQHLLQAALAAGAEIKYNTTAVSLVHQGKKVVGLLAKSAGERQFYLANKGIVLATASIDHNPALARDLSPQHYHDLKYNTCLSTATNTGDGILLGQSVGAAIGGFGGCIDFCGKTGNATDNRVPTLPMIMVNGQGDRFVCEDATYAYHYRAIFQEEKKLFKPTYMIFNQGALGAPGSPWTEENIQADIESGLVISGDSLEDLAQKLEIPYENLLATIEEWNRFAQDGLDPLYGRKTGVQALDQGPYYAYQNSASNLGSLGGLRINTDGKVLDVFGQVIPGLYAAGLNAGEWIGPYYPGSGTAISGIIHQGRKAAQAMAKA